MRTRAQARQARAWPAELFYLLLTETDMGYTELKRLRLVSRGWKEVIETSPLLDKAMFREHVDRPTDPVAYTAWRHEHRARLHPTLPALFYDIWSPAFVSIVDMLTVPKSGRVAKITRRDEQAFSPPEPLVELRVGGTVEVKNATGVTVGDVLKGIVDALAVVEPCAACQRPHPDGKTWRARYAESAEQNRYLSVGYKVSFMQQGEIILPTAMMELELSFRNDDE